MATQIARELGIREILVPPHAGNFSAWGLLGADLLRTRARTRIMELSDGVMAEANGILSSLTSILLEEAEGDDLALEDSLSVSFDMRYVGQEHSLAVEMPYAEGRLLLDAEAAAAAFRSRYELAYGAVLDGAVEIVTLRATRRRSLPRRTESYVPSEAVSSGSGEYFSFYHDRRVLFETVHRSSLVAGTIYPGPAIIYEETTTTYVDADFDYEIYDNGCLSLKRKG